MKKKHPDRRVTLKEIRRHYAGHRSAIRKRLREFRSVHPSEYFYELVYCFLTPQSSAVNADQAVRSLRSAGFQSSDIDPEPILKNKNHYIRFHRKKSFYLLYMKGHGS
jgi:thermostable 8-oxoguanine DNA glycosylase